MNYEQVFFIIGLLLNAILFIPQAIKIYKAKSSAEISLITFLGFNFIQLTTVWHGYRNQDYILAIGYIVSFIACAIVSSLTIYYRVRQ